MVTRWLWGIHCQGNWRAWSVILLFGHAPSMKVVRSIGSEGSSPKLNVTCFFTGSSGGHSSIGSCWGGGCPSVCMGVPPLYILLWDSLGWGCRWRSPGEQLSLSSVGWDCGRLGEGEECLPGWWGKGQCKGEGLWHHCGSFLCLEWEHHLLNPNCLVRGSSLGCLPASFSQCLAEGDWVHQKEQPWECILLHEVGLAGPGSLWRPVQAMCLASSMGNSARHSSCHQWGSTYSPLVNLFSNLQYCSIVGP